MRKATRQGAPPSQSHPFEPVGLLAVVELSLPAPLAIERAVVRQAQDATLQLDIERAVVRQAQPKTQCSIESE